MANVLPDPGHELGLWTYADLGSRSTNFARTGSYSARLQTRQGVFGLPDGESQATSPAVTLTNGAEYRVTLWALLDEVFSSSVDLIVEMDRGNGVFLTLATLEAADFGGAGEWEQTAALSFTAQGTTGYLRISSSEPDPGELLNDRWYVDDGDISEADVAIKLSERAVDAVVSTLQSNLATELTAIDTERGDGVTLAAPANGQYYKREKSEVAGATAHVEVFEGPFEFTHPYSDIDAARATFECPIVIRLTCFNRNGEGADTMRTRLRRYSAGLYNTLIQNATLGGTDAAIQVGAINRIDWDETAGDEEDSVRKVRVVVVGSVKCEETYS